MAHRSSKNKRAIENYAHAGTERANNPPVGLVTPATDPDSERMGYAHDPHIDPQLSWAGKAEHTSFEVPTVSLHVHERIDPRTVIEAVRQRNGAGAQLSLFEAPEENPPIRQAIEFYRHRHNWSNRLIAGDSLLVMNSLLEKEGLGRACADGLCRPSLRHPVRLEFPAVRESTARSRTAETRISPPSRSRFAPSATRGNSVFTPISPISATACCWHESCYIESGSCFVQIGDENVHRAAAVMDEIFGAENRMATVSYATTGASSTAALPEVADYLLWYAKDRKHRKYRQLYEPLTRAEVIESFSWHVMVELPDGQRRKPTPEERFDPDRFLPKDARIYARMPLDSQGVSTTGRSDPYEWNGRIFQCSRDGQWRISQEGLDRLAELGRLEALEGQASLRWRQYENEVPGRRINNIWAAPMSPTDKRYVVQTATKAIQRCVLMSTDPGDLVFDPTCGSGTTAWVAEQWGRRWITCDTSRVAVTIARQRLMTANYDYYELAHPGEGVGAGFRYRSVATVSARTLGYDEPPAETMLYDQPKVDRRKARVTGPFTVEAVPAPTVSPLDEIEAATPADQSISRSGETVRQSDWRDELLKTGIRGKAGQRISFARLEPLPATRWLHAEGETRPDASGADRVRDPGTAYDPQRLAVSFGPDHAPLEQRQVELAIEEAQSLVPKPKIIVFAAFQFDPEASKDIDETRWPGVTLLKAQMNADLLTDDLKKKRASNESFWLIGQPDVAIERIAAGEDAGKLRASVHGFDYYNTRTGNVESGGADRIALWMLDPDYDGRSLFPRQVFFPMAGDADGWARLARNLRAEIDESRIAAYRGTVSLPFEPGEHERAAIKIVDDRGIESLRVIPLTDVARS